MKSQPLATNIESRPHANPPQLQEGTALSRQAKTSSRLHGLQRMVQKAELFAAKGLSYHQTYATWRIRRLASQWQRVPNVPTPLELAAKLTLDAPALAAVRTAHAQGDEAQVQNALQSYFRTRTQPHFFFAAHEQAELVEWVERVDAEGKARTVAVADEICANTFRFRNSEPVTFAGEVDWQHAPNGNTDWRWDLNRHAYFERLGRAYAYTGDERYAQTFSRLLLSWLAHNPASVNDPNWSSVFEVAFRINTWLWAFHLFQHAPSLQGETLAALVAGLWVHGDFLNTHLELHNQNNHLLLEAKSLAMIGLLFPEFKAAAQWRERGLAIFWRELREQVCADGVHGERASLYHRIISGELLELLVLAQNNGIRVPPEATELLGNMAEFELYITKPNGQISLTGDSALEDVHLRFSGASGGAALIGRADLQAVAPRLGEGEIWLLGCSRVREILSAHVNSPKAATLPSRAFAEGGYFTLRSGSGAESFYALFDCGPFGYVHDRTHGHADALSIELFAHGQTWLVDPGVYSTHLGWSWRRFFRGTHAHNTVVVDDQDQSLLLDSRRVYHPANAMLHQWITNDSFDFVAGWHDGYERLPAPVTHHRQLFFAKGGYWLVIDQLLNQHKTGKNGNKGTHTFDLLFHLMPDVKVQLDPATRAAHATNEAGARFDIVPINDKLASVALIEGATHPIQGWVGLNSGEKQTAPTVRYRRTEAAPTVFCTLLMPHAANAPAQPVQATQIPLITARPLDDVLHARAVCVESDAYCDTILLAVGSAGIVKHFGDFESDAEIVYVRQHKQSGDVLTVEMHRGTTLMYQSQSIDPTKYSSDASFRGVCDEESPSALQMAHNPEGDSSLRSE